MNLSRAAKKFRAQMPKPSEAAQPANAKKTKSPPAAVPPVPDPAPPVEPVAPAEPVAEAPAEVTVPAQPAQPKKAWPEKTKRPRFVREKGEKREQAPAAGPALPPRSTKFTAKLLTKNLAVAPADETPPTGR